MGVMIVSNTSPLINLAAIGMLKILPQIYTTITIPQAVYTEIIITGHGQPGAMEIQTASWIDVQPVTNTSLVTTMMDIVNSGEAEAIALSIECSAQLLLIDERKGRNLAMKHGVPITGLLGVLTVARQRHLIHAVQPVMDDLRHVGFWIDQKLYDHIVHLVGEA